MAGWWGPSPQTTTTTAPCMGDFPPFHHRCSLFLLLLLCSFGPSAGGGRPRSQRRPVRRRGRGREGAPQLETKALPRSLVRPFSLFVPPPPSPALTSEKNTSPAPFMYNCDVKDEKGEGEGSTFSSAKKMPGGQIFEHPDRYRPVCAPRPSLPFLVSGAIFGPIFLSPPSLPAPNRRLSQTIPPPSPFYLPSASASRKPGVCICSFFPSFLIFRVHTLLHTKLPLIESRLR